MATLYKVLGQTISTAATASSVDNLFIEPSFERGASSSVSVTGTGSAYQYNRLASGQSTATTVPSGNSPWIFSSPGTASSTYTYGYVSSYGYTNQSGSYAMGVDGSASTTVFTGYACNPNSPSATDAINTSLASQRMPVSPSTTYYFSVGVAYAGSSQPGGLTAEMWWYDSNNTYITNTSIWSNSYPGSSNSFNRFQTTMTSPSNAAYAAFRMYNQTHSNGNGWRFDGFVFSSNSSLYSTYSDGTSNTTLYPGDQTFITPYSNRILGWEGTANLSRTVRTYAGSLKTLYRTPENTQTVCSTLLINNPNTSSTNYRIAVFPAGSIPSAGTLSMSNFLAFDHTIAAQSTTTFTIGMTLGQGDIVYVSSDASNIGFTLFGSEITP